MLKVASTMSMLPEPSASRSSIKQNKQNDIQQLDYYIDYMTGFDMKVNAKSVNEYMIKAQESWDLVMSNIGKLTSEQQKVALRYKKAGRSLVQGDSVEGLFIHEMGHHMQWTGVPPKETNNITANKSKYASKISGYATTSNSEYLAESFSAYMNGEKKNLDPDYVSVIEKKQKRIVTQTVAGDNKVLKVKKSIDFPTIRLSKQEYAHVMSELATNMSKEQRKVLKKSNRKLLLYCTE